MSAVSGTGLLVLVRTVTESASAFAVTTSGSPSSFRSPTATDVGWFPVANGPEGEAAKLPPAVWRSTVTLSESAFAATRSRLPSPLKSAIATDYGRVSTPNGPTGVKVSADADAGTIMQTTAATGMQQTARLEPGWFRRISLDLQLDLLITRSKIGARPRILRSK